MSTHIAVRRFEPARLDELAPSWLALHHHHRATTTSAPIMDEVDRQLAAIGIDNVEISVMQGNGSSGGRP